MARGADDELKRLKQDYLDLDRTHQDERELLARIIQALATCASSDSRIAEHVEVLRRKTHPDDPLDSAALEAELDRLKNRLLLLEEEPETVEGTLSGLDESEARFVEACRILRRIMVTLLEDFYPIRPQLESQADGIHLVCSGDVENLDLSGPSKAFMSFLEGLKENIAGDFREISNTLFTLLDHVKELEKTFSDEFGGHDGRVKEIEYFEMEVNREVGTIVESFDLHTTVSEIKQAVIRKIDNIKEIISHRKQEEMSRVERFQENIESLTRRIQEVEKDAREMSQRAEQAEVAASRDELTGLYNRKSFDERIRVALETFRNGGRPFALVLFDVDRFKDINDTFGHVAGDKVLQKVADCLRSTFRKSDFIARYGGDEFVVLIEELSRELARDKIMTFMKHLQRLRFTSHARGDITVGVSPGISMAQKGDSAESLLERADQAMYDVKNRRR
ncbi:MAG: GGDEF domain-containing protein [Desulfobacteraceae bacterium]|jgi:diguanylate cyclase